MLWREVESFDKNSMSPENWCSHIEVWETTGSANLRKHKYTVHKNCLSLQELLVDWLAFLAALAILPRTILKNRMNSSFSFKSSWYNSSYSIIKIILGKTASAARNWLNSSLQTQATIFVAIATGMLKKLKLKYPVTLCTKEYVYSYKEETAALFVVTTSALCLRKPEAVRKTITEFLAAVLSNIILCQCLLHWYLVCIVQ